MQVDREEILKKFMMEVFPASRVFDHEIILERFLIHRFPPRSAEYEEQQKIHAERTNIQNAIAREKFEIQNKINEEYRITVEAKQAIALQKKIKELMAAEEEDSILKEAKRAIAVQKKIKELMAEEAKEDKE
jgi:hypothetical protein